ncbi:MAG: GNAT family N-acetyltransferase [Dehalococcoidia bacterium]
MRDPRAELRGKRRQVRPARRTVLAAQHPRHGKDDAGRLRAALLFRPETPDDHDAVRAVVVSAFPTDLEARIVDDLRAGGYVTLSLVAEDEGTIVGSAVFSLMTVEGPDAQLRAVGLGPLAVAPSHQKLGAGSALVRSGIDQLRQAGFDVIALLGSTEYYPRFGFRTARDLNLHAADPSIPASHFQALMLRGDPPAEATWLRYAPSFFIE